MSLLLEYYKFKYTITQEHVVQQRFAFKKMSIFFS